MAQRPRGTVTFLFTDVEGSTRLLKQLRDSYGSLLEAHQRLLREAFAAHGGEEVDTQGDAFFYVFSRARDAAAAAADGQRALASHDWPEGADFRVRMGMHTGEPALSDEGRYHGMGVHRTARIMAAGHGGQILASQATASVLHDDELDGITVHDLGEHKLKDLERPERIYELLVDGLEQTFAPLKTESASTVPLPFYRRPLVIDAFAGPEQLRTRAELRLAWRELLAARRRHDELTRDAAATEARLAELRALVEDTQGFDPGFEDTLRAERERFRHTGELVEAVAAAAGAIDPDDGDGAADLIASAERAVAGVERLAPELAWAGDELRDVELRLRETASVLRAFLTSVDADPGRVEDVEARLDRIADAKRRFRCSSYEELLARAAEARDELARLGEGGDPAAAAAQELSEAEERVSALARALAAARQDAAEPFARGVAAELAGIGLGEGEFRVDLRERSDGLGPTGTDEVAFLIRPNRGMRFAPVAETASGGELSRIALAIAAVGGGTTMVFDEIDAGIGGQTAHAVAETLVRLAERAQVITITHLPQIASRADRHFRVEKVPGDPTHTRIQELTDEERRDELERMLGGREFLAALGEAEQGAPLRRR